MSAIFKIFLKKNGSIMVSGKQHGEAYIQFQLMNLIKKKCHYSFVLELFLGVIREVNSQGPSGQHPAGVVWLFSHIHLWAHEMYLMLVNYHVSLDPTEKLALEALSPHPFPISDSSVLSPSILQSPSSGDRMPPATTLCWEKWKWENSPRIKAVCPWEWLDGATAYCVI